MGRRQSSWSGTWRELGMKERGMREQGKRGRGRRERGRKVTLWCRT